MSEENGKDIFSVEYFSDHLQKIARNTRLTNPKFHVVTGSNVGDNFAGLVYRAVIKGEKDGAIQTVYSILKCPPFDANHRRVVDSRTLFLREIYFYEKILPTFNDFLKEYNLTVEHVPIFYGACKEDEKELLILEDLNRKGYTMKNTKLLDYPHASIALHALAKMHAYSFALRAKNPEVLDRIKVTEDAIFTKEKIKFIDEHGRYYAFSEIVAKALADEDEHYRNRLENFRKNFATSMLDAVDGNAVEPYAVITHGDAWTNNLLFKYDKDTSMPTDVCFVDFQSSRYASPVLDIVYMLFTCYPTEIRRKHYDLLLRDYHKSLSEHLLLLGCNPKTVFPYEVFMEHMKRFGKFATIMATFILHVFIDDKVKNIDDLVNAESLLKRVETDSAYRNIIRDTFKDLIDRNYL